jgi:hypothetical protein
MELHARDDLSSKKKMELQPRERVCEKYKHLASIPLQSPVIEDYTNNTTITSETKLGGSNTLPMIPVTIGLLILLILIMLIIIFFTFKNKYPK